MQKFVLDTGTNKSKVKTYERERWTLEEDNLLRQIISIYGTNWCQVASNFPERNPNSCIQRWKRLVGRKKNKKQKWSIKEDNLLQKLVALQGKKWNQISKHFNEKTNKQCMERYNNCLNPNLNRKPFTSKEDDIIYQNYICFGSKWSKISTQLNGRTQNQVKNRFYSCIISSHLKLQNPYFTKQSSQQAKEALEQARLEHKEKFLQENENLNSKEFEQSQLHYVACESQSFSLEQEDVYSNIHPLK